MAKDTDERDLRERDDGDTGIECPLCGCADTSVWRTRPWNGKVRRERLCAFCGEIFRTTESLQ